MDLHLSTDKVVSIKDALFRYAVIVAGILTALGLNQWAESRQHAHQGAEALASLESEMLRNKALLGKSLKQLREQQKNFASAEEMLGEKSFDVPDLPARVKALLDDQKINLTFGTSLSALQHSAWDAAVVSQSLQYIPLDRRVALARSYSLLGEVSGIVRATVVSDSVLARVASADMFQRGESKDALKFARAIRDQGFLIQVLLESYGAMEKTIDSALAGGAAPGAPQPDAPAAGKASDSASAPAPR